MFIHSYVYSFIEFFVSKKIDFFNVSCAREKKTLVRDNGIFCGRKKKKN